MEWFKLFARRWLSDTELRASPTTHEGILIRLIAHAAESGVCGIDADASAAHRLCRPDVSLEDVETVLANFFVIHPENQDLRTHPELYRQYVERLAKSEQARSAARRKWEKHAAKHADASGAASVAASPSASIPSRAPARQNLKKLESTYSPSESTKARARKAPKKAKVPEGFTAESYRVDQAYPDHRRSTPTETTRIVRKLKKAGVSVERMLESIEAAKRSKDWIREDGRYVPRLGKYFTNGSWAKFAPPVGGVARREALGFANDARGYASGEEMRADGLEVFENEWGKG